MNLALFEKLYVDDDKVTDADFNPPFDELLAARDAANGSTASTSRSSATRTDIPVGEGMKGCRSATPLARFFWAMV